MKPKSAKAKGRTLQNQLAKDIEAIFGPGMCRPRIMGESGCDLDVAPAVRYEFPYAIEAKNVESLQIWPAIRQARENAAEAQIPAVVFKKNGEQPYIVLPWQYFLTMLRARKVVPRGTD